MRALMALLLTALALGAPAAGAIAPFAAMDLSSEEAPPDSGPEAAPDDGEPCEVINLEDYRQGILCAVDIATCYTYIAAGRSCDA